MSFVELHIKGGTFCCRKNICLRGRERKRTKVFFLKRQSKTRKSTTNGITSCPPHLRQEKRQHHHHPPGIWKNLYSLLLLMMMRRAKNTSSPGLTHRTLGVNTQPFLTAQGTTCRNGKTKGRQKHPLKPLKSR